MRTATSNYNTYNALLYKQPVYIVEIGASTTKWVSGTFANIGSYTTKKYLISVRASSAEINIHQPEITSGTFEVIILDKDLEFTGLLESASRLGDALVIKAGFQELDYADFVTLTPANTLITRISLGDDLMTWRLEARDSLFELIGMKFNNLSLADGTGHFVEGQDSELTVQLTAGATTEMFLTNDSNILNYTAQADLDNDADARVFTCVKIDSEIIKYTTVDTGLYKLQTLTRGVGNSTDATHAVGATVKRGLGFNCDPLRILLHLLMTTAIGGNEKYDLGVAGIGDNFDGIWSQGGVEIYFTSSQIAMENIERLGWKVFHADNAANTDEFGLNGYIYLFHEDQDNVIDFIQNKLLKPHGMALMIRDGKLDVWQNDWVDFYENFSADDALTASNIKSITGFTLGNEEEVHYGYGIKYNYDHGAGTFASSFTDSHNPAASTHYPDVRLDIEHTGMIGSQDTDQITNFVFYRFQNFLDQSTLLTVENFHKQLLLEPGDTPTITFANLPNIHDGTRGWTTQKALIVGQEIDFDVNGAATVINRCRVFDTPGYVLTGDNYYSINKVVEGSINDKALTVSTDETATTEAADAYYDNSGTNYDALRIIFFIRITQPNYGAGSTFETLDLMISWLSAGPTIQNSNHRRYINFNPQASTAFTIALDLVSKSGSADTPDRVKVDWVSTTATGSEIPTVEFVGVWFVT
jgi:hypothetical protein